jgi:class 3 adenylate cyclase
MLVSIPGDELFAVRAAMATGCIAWPHIAYWLALRRGGDRRAETTNILLESFFASALVAGFSLRLWPTVALFTIGSINAMLWGGPRFFAAAVSLGLAAAILASLLLGIEPHLGAEPINTALSIAAIFAYVMMVGNTTYRLRIRQREMREALRREERQAHELLVNVFPQAIIPRLKVVESPIADQFADVTVVFVDIVGFTPLSERLGPKRMVLLLNELFRKFDAAAARLGVEKIETTGDGYLAVGGAPEPLDHHPEAVAQFALAALQAARETRISDAEHVEIRIGIHTGPVFAGVVGESRFHYKVFGETVNTASRIQAQSEPGRILVSETTYKRIRAAHDLEEHRVVDLKGHGPVKVHWLLAKKATR